MSHALNSTSTLLVDGSPTTVLHMIDSVNGSLRCGDLDYRSHGFLSRAGHHSDPDELRIGIDRHIIRVIAVASGVYAIHCVP